MPTSTQTPSSLANLPAPLRPLIDLAYNFWWTWASPVDSSGSTATAADLFAWISPKLWERTSHNPIAVLQQVGEQRLEELAADPAFVGSAAAAWRQLEAHRTGPTWWSKQNPLRQSTSSAANPAAANSTSHSSRPLLAAYFCAEFGLSECFQIYSGGLGLLAGDHLKSASGLGIPLVAVGLLYRAGYFHQSLDADGQQVERFPEMNFDDHPVRRVVDANGKQVTVSVQLPGREVSIAVWRADVGRIPLYLLDTNLPANTPADREITRGLYLGDHDMRIRQEIVLGIGGVRAIAALGLDPTVCHMNEGHAGFMALERTRIVRERTGSAATFDQAREATAAGHVFTTHTPVPAGIDRFAPSLVAHYFESYHDSLGLDMEGFLALGRENVADKTESFSMAVLAIRLSRFANGVSRLHGRVSRGMWRNIWPGTPRDDIPIGHVTNGVHTTGWIGPRVGSLLDQHLGRAWRDEPHDPRAWERLADLPDDALWSTRQESRIDLVAWCRRRVRNQVQSRAGSDAELAAASRVLSPDVLTIGFARRFAAYKRGTLLLRDPARLLRLLRAEHPIQLVLSGKAHPGDGGGKRLIKELVQFARQHKVDDRLVFLEDYDIEVARQLVRGCDAWLNTPIRGLEASGTSGMKAAMNGVINVSTLDGWWDEGFASDLGFHIESLGTFDHDLPNEQREDFESDSLYRLLEHQLIPEFYERDSRGVPHAWTARMRRCIQQLAPRFSTHRMLIEYAERYYLPAHHAAMRLENANIEPARAVSDHIDRLRTHWRRVHINDVQSEPGRGRPIMDVAAVVELNGLSPSDVLVQLSQGQLDSHGELINVTSHEMSHDRDLRDGAHRFTVRFEPTRTPREAWIVRVLPRHKCLIHPFVPGLIACSTLQRADAHQDSPHADRGPRA